MTIAVGYIKVHWSIYIALLWNHQNNIWNLLASVGSKVQILFFRFQIKVSQSNPEYCKRRTMLPAISPAMCAVDMEMIMLLRISSEDAYR